MKVGIIGMGWVGSSIAISTLHSGVATDLLVNDARAAVAEGEALDLAQGASFYPAATVQAAAVEDMRDLDAVVITAGRGGKPEESRLDLLRDNAAIVRGIARRLSGFRGLLIVVSNPVDIMTRVAAEAADLPSARVLGTGTMLDTARLRQRLGRELDLDARAVHAHVVGEHGDSEVVLWSAARIGGVPLREWRGWTREREPIIAAEVRRAAYEIIARKGATNHAIGLVTAALLRWALRDERRILTVSRVQEGALGVRDLAISLPAVVGRHGAAEVIEPGMSADERTAFDRSVAVLRQAASGL
ncbi:MAG TPA: L-lactate dehydrogenase [Vicinamibacterales bacterium]